MQPHSELLAVGFYLIKCHTVAISGLMELILCVRDLVRSHLSIHYECSFSPAALFPQPHVNDILNYNSNVGNYISANPNSLFCTNEFVWLFFKHSFRFNGLKKKIAIEAFVKFTACKSVSCSVTPDLKNQNTEPPSGRTAQQIDCLFICLSICPTTQMGGWRSSGSSCPAGCYSRLSVSLES